jgi:hypothetical protein
MGLFHRRLIDFSASHTVGAFDPSATPDAFLPRNEGQFCAGTPAARLRQMHSDIAINFIAFSRPGYARFQRAKLCAAQLGIYAGPFAEDQHAGSVMGTRDSRVCTSPLRAITQQPSRRTSTLEACVPRLPELNS